MHILACGGSTLDPQFHGVAQTLGEVIGTSHTLIFGGMASPDGGRSTDDLVAEAAERVLREHGRKIERRIVTVVPQPDRFPRVLRGRVLTVHGTDPAERRKVMVGAANVVISIAGDLGTADILNFAYRLRKPFLPLAFTGGSSAKQWNYYKSFIVPAMRLDGDDVAFLESGRGPLRPHLTRILGRFEDHPQPLRLAIASANDLDEERARVREVAAELNEGIGAILGVHIEPQWWETDAPAGLHRGGPSGAIDETVIDKADIVVAIIRDRLGDGTEHEIVRALEAWKEDGRPQLMLYRGAQASDARIAGLEARVWEHGIGRTYADAAGFERILRRDLTAYLRNGWN